MSQIFGIPPPQPPSSQGGVSQDKLNDLLTLLQILNQLTLLQNIKESAVEAQKSVPSSTLLQNPLVQQNLLPFANQAFTISLNSANNITNLLALYAPNNSQVIEYVAQMKQLTQSKNLSSSENLSTIETILKKSSPLAFELTSRGEMSTEGNKKIQQAYVDYFTQLLDVGEQEIKNLSGGEAKPPPGPPGTPKQPPGPPKQAQDQSSALLTVVQAQNGGAQGEAAARAGSSDNILWDFYNSTFGFLGKEFGSLNAIEALFALQNWILGVYNGILDDPTVVGWSQAKENTWNDYYNTYHNTGSVTDAKQFLQSKINGWNSDLAAEESTKQKLEDAYAQAINNGQATLAQELQGQITSIDISISSTKELISDAQSYMGSLQANPNGQGFSFYVNNYNEGNVLADDENKLVNGINASGLGGLDYDYTFLSQSQTKYLTASQQTTQELSKVMAEVQQIMSLETSAINTLFSTLGVFTAAIKGQ